MDEHRHLSEGQLRALVLHAHGAEEAPTGARCLPAGGLTELYGPELSGKTTAALRFVAQTQRDGGLVAYIDADGRLDRDYADSLGVDCARVTFAQTGNGTDAHLAERLLDYGALSLLVIDSVAGLCADGPDLDRQVRLVARTCARIGRATASTGASVLITHTMTETDAGELVGHPAGRVLRFYAALRVDVRHVLSNGWSLP